MTTQSYQVPGTVLFYGGHQTRYQSTVPVPLEYGIRHTSIYYGVQYTGIPGTIDPAVTLYVYSTNSFHGT